MNQAATPTAFYAEAQPCEVCGHPSYRARVFDPESQLFIAVDCECSIPQEPMCPALEAPLLACRYVSEVAETIRNHRASCNLCGPRKVVEMPTRAEFEEAA